ncbi:MAG: 23S rRNA (uracil-5-)-methyltransferase RumA, partial [Chloroflexi bacterium]|nr:23S rRNA (uracil-5-)-methyltransferase RumA [Chloroflexota bacterium]
ALEWIEKLLPNQIIYVSCELKTLKRDLNKLTNNYSIRKVIPVDMFPHTKHVECIVSLEKIN